MADQPAGRERVRWLCEFLLADLSEPRHDELLALGVDAARYLLGPQARLDEDERVMLTGSDEREEDTETGVPYPPSLVAAVRRLSVLRRLQAVVRAGTDALDSESRWAVSDVVMVSDLESTEKVQPAPPAWVLEEQDDGTIARRYEGDVGAVLAASAAGLIAEWWPELRRCDYDRCGALFLPEHGRQRYHQPACSNRARQARHVAENGSPDQERDHSEEYRRRLRRDAGERCRATTNAGHRCKRTATADSDYCAQHEALREDE